MRTSKGSRVVLAVAAAMAAAMAAAAGPAGATVTGEWEALSPAFTLPAISQGCMASIPRTPIVLAWGGFDGSGFQQAGYWVNTETGQSGSLATVGAPPARYVHTCSMLHWNDDWKLTVSGGQDSVSGDQDTVWGVGLNTGWDQLAGVSVVGAGGNGYLLAASDSSYNNRFMVQYGGVTLIGSSTRVSDVWVIDPLNPFGATANNLTVSSGSVPVGRNDATLVRRGASQDQFLMFGGIASVAPFFFNDIEVLTVTNFIGAVGFWSSLAAGSGPAPSSRYGGWAASNPITDGFWIGYGSDNTQPYFSDVWAHDDNNGAASAASWLSVTPTGSPATQRWRFQYTTIQDPASCRTRMIMQGGYQTIQTASITSAMSALDIGPSDLCDNSCTDTNVTLLDCFNANTPYVASVGQCTPTYNVDGIETFRAFCEPDGSNYTVITYQDEFCGVISNTWSSTSGTCGSFPYAINCSACPQDVTTGTTAPMPTTGTTAPMPTTGVATTGAVPTTTGVLPTPCNGSDVDLLDCTNGNLPYPITAGVCSAQHNGAGIETVIGTCSADGLNYTIELYSNPTCSGAPSNVWSGPSGVCDPSGPVYALNCSACPTAPVTTTTGAAATAAATTGAAPQPCPNGTNTVLIRDCQAGGAPVFYPGAGGTCLDLGFFGIEPIEATCNPATGAWVINQYSTFNCTGNISNTWTGTGSACPAPGGSPYTVDCDCATATPPPSPPAPTPASSTVSAATPATTVTTAAATALIAVALAFANSE